MNDDAIQDDQLRQAALARLRKKRGLQAHLLAYVTVNALLISIWAITSPGGFFWPVIPMFGWGIGLAFNIWDVYSPQPSEKKIRTEMERLARQ